MDDFIDQKVSIIGSGRVATSLAHAFKAQGIFINEIYSRSITHAEKLSRALPGSSATDSLDLSHSESKLFVVAVSDDTIHEVVGQFQPPKGALLFHTSGTVPIEILDTNAGGIFYPLQTFTLNKVVDFKTVPILIEGTDTHAEDVLLSLGSTISNHVKLVSGEERKKLHIAAVFASNFTNRMLAAAEEILQDTSLDLKILEPLVFESIQNAFDFGTDKALTGPAKRGDSKTIESHLKSLDQNPALKSIYDRLTAMITSKFSRPN
ncbi:Predicted oxidoreductase, contains short-chain dehydrogenase (SDR) and DUF2520 domains [Reichenbachiella faecimaris]|uniref:Predicted oxidoreductase, contains short-chain dehydrogenase (SDR) and DUF2520 domains n=1 Tax=Reichenbachiella faecimaris TaxID=692418 RepID=A0A1W2GIC9_REIFA|nr:Rossmann-like and DUF2520 domain-containing protein [Reichenbachiella faecimaris]SMD36397.1 Predicted oxidoreductase, contains short-chain dehydrogenase (SDR) and DUF2520 domains [Reichenbachiella faecimaris]